MKIKNICALLLVAVAGAAALPGCNDKDMRPDKDAVLQENGLQSADLRDMAAKLAPTVTQTPEILQSPFKVTVVVKPPRNELEGESTRDMGIFVQKLANNLMQYSSEHIAFVEERAVAGAMAAQEGVGATGTPFENDSRYPGSTPDPRIKPQFALTAKFQSIRNEQTTYYLCTFELVNLTTNQIIWMRDWDTRTRNLH